MKQMQLYVYRWQQLILLLICSVYSYLTCFSHYLFDCLSWNIVPTLNIPNSYGTCDIVYYERLMIASERGFKYQCLFLLKIKLDNFSCKHFQKCFMIYSMPIVQEENLACSDMKAPGTLIMINYCICLLGLEQKDFIQTS